MSNKLRLLAAIVSISSFALYILSVSLLGVYHPMLFLVVTLLCVAASLPAGWLARGASWRWGLWVSSSFWVFLLFVFVSFLVNQETQLGVLLEAAIIAGSACAAAGASESLARPIRAKVLEE